jgi:hypothetical protein
VEPEVAQEAYLAPAEAMELDLQARATVAAPAEVVAQALEELVAAVVVQQEVQALAPALLPQVKAMGLL